MYISFQTSFYISNHWDTSYVLFTIFKVLFVTFWCINYQKWIFASDMKGRFNFHVFPHGKTPYPGIIYGIHFPLPTDLTCSSPLFNCTRAFYSVLLISCQSLCQQYSQNCSFIISFNISFSKFPFFVLLWKYLGYSWQFGGLGFCCCFANLFLYSSFRLKLIRFMKNLLQFGVSNRSNLGKPRHFMFSLPLTWYISTFI